MEAAADHTEARGAAEGWPLPHLRARPPYLVGAGTVASCGLGRAQDPSELVGVAHSAIGHDRLAEADNALDDALDQVVCGPVDPAIVHRIWFLKASSPPTARRAPLSRSAFANARIADPDRPWDEAFVDGRTWFDAAVPQDAPIRLHIVPDPGSVRVDGKPTDGDIAIAAGSHHVEIGERWSMTLRVEVMGQGTATVVVPALLPTTSSRGPPSRSGGVGSRWCSTDLPGAPTAFGLYEGPDLWWSQRAQGPFERRAPAPLPRARRVPEWAWIGGGVGVAGATAAVWVHDPTSIVDKTGEFADPRRVRSVRSGHDDYRRWKTCVVVADTVAIGGLTIGTVGILGRRNRRSDDADAQP